MTIEQHVFISLHNFYSISSISAQERNIQRRPLPPKSSNLGSISRSRLNSLVHPLKGHQPPPHDQRLRPARLGPEPRLWCRADLQLGQVEGLRHAPVAFAFPRVAGNSAPAGRRHGLGAGRGVEVRNWRVWGQRQLGGRVTF